MNCSRLDRINKKINSSKVIWILFIAVILIDQFKKASDLQALYLFMYKSIPLVNIYLVLSCSKFCAGDKYPI